MTAEPPEGYVFSHLDDVRYADLDAMRHLNNVVFLQFFESARIRWIGTLFPDHDPVNPTGELGLILARAEIDYLAPAFYGEPIRTWLRPGRLGRSSLALEFLMRSERDGRDVAKGGGVLVAYDYANERSMPWPERVRAAIGGA